ncbi:MAG TPA: amidohydrolase, partial [Blastocatellia bacterium]|nr:amidohydrolase [Blastocatellia bacterium]
MLNRSSSSRVRRVVLVVLMAAAFAAQTLATQSAKQSVASGKRYPRLVIRNAMVVDGNGTPASGPKDIVITGNTISEIVALDPVALREGRASRPQGDAEIDATGKYVLPGLINEHGHVQYERAGVAQPVDYCLKLWLACGITAVRDVGSDTKQTIPLRDKSAKGEAVAPRLFIYTMFGYPPAPRNADEARSRVREIKQSGADGIKILGVDRDIMAALLDEAHKLGLRVAHHAGVEETNAWDDIKFGSTSIEHWYGIPDAAIDSGRQNF